MSDLASLRAAAPLLDGWLRFREQRHTPWTTPGHKGRTDVVGDVVAGDVPLYGGVDTIREQRGRLLHAQQQLAALWQAQWARISVGGSTHGNQTLCLAVGRPGDAVVVNRNLHRSQLVGLILAGLVPLWVRPDVDPRVGLPVGVPGARVADALDGRPDAAAVMLVEPAYVGSVSDVAAHAAAAHAHDVPLLVDQAWGAHFGFHPAYPPHALQAGADAFVASAHKTLPAYTQSAFLLANSGRLDLDRLTRAFDALATTSPSGTVMASADAARALLAVDGHDRLEQLRDLVADARDELRDRDGVVVVDDRSVPGLVMDPAKLVLSLPESGIDGLALEDALVEAGHPIEMADHDTVVPLITLADDAASVHSLIDVLRRVLPALRGVPRSVVPSVAWSVEPDVVMPPRDAFFAAHATVSREAAVGRVCAELVAPYPPGVPVLAPGERVSADAVDGLRFAMRKGTQVRYAADPTLETIQVVA